MNEHRAARLGVDIGGTFTDVALEVGERRYSTKVLTTPAAPEKGVMEAVLAMVGEARIAAAEVGLVIHGTTLATNALIERKGARTALITTEGYRDTLEIRGEDRYELYDLDIELPKPLVPRRWRYAVPERIDARGKVLLPLRDEDLLALVPRLKDARIEAVAVGFLHSYANPAHEKRAGELLARALPGVAVSLSCEVSPEMREYERFSTACANAYVQPKMASYLGALQAALKDAGFRCPLLLMLSGGGVATVETSIRFPVRLVESGPAGGAIFSAHIARQCGLDQVLSYDMGGTTAKICLIDAGQPQTGRSFEVARIYRFKKGSGLPLRIPVIEMVEIGAGGGSIAHVDALSRIAVGPESAGSEPGPACYGRGGRDATVTDADVALGKIDPQDFAGGRIALDAKAAEAALNRAVGERLGLSPPLAAFGVAEMVDENMSNAARVHAIESGKDVSVRSLVAFGGAAPLHAARVADKLEIDHIIVPTGAGVGSAVGFLRAPVAYEVVRSSYQRLSAFDAEATNRILGEMQAEAAAVVRQAALGAPLAEKRIAFMRYFGQGHEIAVEVPARPLSQADRALLQESFEREYSRLYSRVVPGVDVELLTWTVLVSTEPGETPRLAEDPAAYEAKPDGARSLFDAESGAFVTVPVYRRARLKPGARFAGPAVVTEAETTTIVSPAFDVRVDGYGYLHCERRRAAAER
jgi:N-methylhydantoinase A